MEETRKITCEACGNSIKYLASDITIGNERTSHADIRGDTIMADVQFVQCNNCGLANKVYDHLDITGGFM